MIPNFFPTCQSPESDAAGAAWQKVAIAVVHGIGAGDPDYNSGKADQPEFIRSLQNNLIDRFSKLGISDKEYHQRFVMAPVYWATVLEGNQQDLWARFQRQSAMNWDRIREFMVSFVSDAIAYQVSPRGRHSYHAIHRFCAQTLHTLAQKAGPKAPLCVIGHSLGSIVSYNYLLDLQAEFGNNTEAESLFRESVLRQVGNSPLERGETLSLYYTLGSPLALWTLRDRDGGLPIQFPAPRLTEHYPQLNSATEWVNVYDSDDVIAYPLRPINSAFQRAVKEDLNVNAGEVWESWNPLSHNGYWKDPETGDRIARSLLNLSRLINGR